MNLQKSILARNARFGSIDVSGVLKNKRSVISQLEVGRDPVGLEGRDISAYNFNFRPFVGEIPTLWSVTVLST
jgi:hypothetical protein